jgi:hypothetical protein
LVRVRVVIDLHKSGGPMSHEEPMRYEAPKIVRREDIKGLLSVAVKSDVPSDVNIKENIVPVTWSRDAYEPPAVASREPLAALLLDTVKSDHVVSDVHLKENIVAVTWSGEPYEPPAVVAREQLAGLLVVTVKSDVSSSTP